MKVFFARGRTETNSVSEKQLFVNNCGYYRDVTAPIGVVREKGRLDYQLIFVRQGTFRCNDQTLTDGTAFLFFPGDKQDYVYQPAERCSYFWVHFSGTEVEKLLDGFGLERGVIEVGERSALLEDVFRLMTGAYSGEMEQCDEFSAGALRSALALVASPTPSFSPFKKAVRSLENFSEPVRVTDLAQIYNLSEEHFIRAFKNAFGCSPLAYRLKKQTEEAKTLLSNTNLPVSAVADLCGFADPFYFSRTFKKHTGYSPSTYRNSL